MTKAASNNLLIGALVAVSAVFIFLWIRGRKVFNRQLAIDVIENYAGRKFIDRTNENQDDYLFAWWFAISRNQIKFVHNGNEFLTKTGDFPRVT